MEDGKIIPIKYKVEEGVLNPSTITIKCTDVDGQVNKEELATYTAATPKETLIQIYEGILTIERRYGWIDENKGKLLFQHFGRSLKGEPLRRWEKATKNLRTFTLATFKSSWNELVEEEFGEEAYDDQIEYLLGTRKPKEMTVTEWIDRLEVINNGAA